MSVLSHQSEPHILEMPRSKQNILVGIFTYEFLLLGMKFSFSGFL